MPKAYDISLFSKNLCDSQPNLTEFLVLAIRQKKLSNAYLFLGDALSDKLAVSKELAQILNCERNSTQNQRLEPPCQVCINCKWIGADTHPMLPIYLKPDDDSKKSIIKIEQINNLRLELTKTSQYYRIVVVPEASYEVLSKYSANALLKILEEPNANTLFILCANEEDTVLSTILSRTQKLRFTNNALCKSSEEAREIFNSHIEKIKNIENNSRLEIMLLAEELAQYDSKLLHEFFELLQNETADCLNTEGAEIDLDLQKADFVFAVEQAKNDLRNFVRPRAAIEELMLSARIQANLKDNHTRVT